MYFIWLLMLMLLLHVAVVIVYVVMLLRSKSRCHVFCNWLHFLILTYSIENRRHNFLLFFSFAFIFLLETFSISIELYHCTVWFNGGCGGDDGICSTPIRFTFIVWTTMFMFQAISYIATAIAASKIHKYLLILCACCVFVWILCN